ncbi:AlbA family DNA-binding domain-containing protein [Streptomyces tirandamycinicus]|uniref:AlbA family DNA-binding domain-containing protein n=1 Tax=Streptomyces tirandamycinicus TaxID=2174846 RepID=UPI00142E7D38|nr:ATP-binding protein [Streptomyces tirandamycinicus]
MASLSRSALIEALAAGRPDDLLGVAEASWVDFKRSPYDLASDKGKYELCKDVAAFANAHGGLLVLGVVAEKKNNQALEVATDLRPFPQSRVDVVKYVDTLNEYLRPRVAVSHHWYHDPARSAAEADHYYLVIEVEPVPEPSRYVLVRRMINDKERFVDGLAVPVRHGDRTVYMPSEDVYQLINEGVRARDAAAVGAALAPPGAEWGEQADQVLDELEQRQDWEEAPVLFWQSFPARPVTGILPGLHSNDGIKRGLKYQDVLRPSGFNFQDSTGRLQTLNGGLYLGRTRCAVWVRPDGLVTAGATATSDMLCWAMNDSAWAQRLNVHVLTEMTLEYFRIADRLVAPRVAGPWQHRVVTRRFQGDRPRSLGPGGSGLQAFLSDASAASADSWDQSWPADGDPERDAYEALVRVYALFGLDVSTNPDVDSDRVSEERLRAT